MSERERPDETGQLVLGLPNRQPLRGLPAAQRAELLDVIAQMLLQAESHEAVGRTETRGSSDHSSSDS